MRNRSFLARRGKNRINSTEPTPLTSPCPLSWTLSSQQGAPDLQDPAEGGPRARVLMPETGQGSVLLTAEQLLQRYAGVTLFVRPHFRFDSRTPDVRKPAARHWFWSAILGQRFVYRVYETRSVARTDLSMVEPTSQPIISLFTCTGTWDPLAWDYTERLFVRARLVAADGGGIDGGPANDSGA